MCITWPQTRLFVWGSQCVSLSKCMIYTDSITHFRHFIVRQKSYVTKSLNSYHGCSASCVYCHMCEEVWWSHHIVWNLNSPPSTCSFQEKSKWEQCGRRCLRREGMRHWISAWESVPASSFWAAETPPEGHDAARFPSTKPSTWASQALPPHQDEERKENTCFNVSPPASLHLG